jgi:hypothetical protein
MPVGPESFAVEMFLFAPDFHHLASETLLGYSFGTCGNFWALISSLNSSSPVG